jgi:Ca2+-dependent lipid-binding protein
MTMNIQEMLSGSGVKTKTHALGVIMVTIHHATGLSAQDASGYSDPYIVLAYAKFGKPIYSTRIIEKELNPVFEETAFLLLSEDEIQSKEKLSVMLWDSGWSRQWLFGFLNETTVDFFFFPFAT